MFKYICLCTLLLVAITTSHSKVLEKLSNGDYKILKSKFTLSEIVTDYASLNGLGVVVEREIKGSYERQGGNIISQKNIEEYISYLCNESGITIMKGRDGRSLKIIYARDVRYHPVELIEKAVDIPDNHYYTSFAYKLNYAKSRDLTRGFRPFMSRYGRIIEFKSDNSILIQDTGKNIKRLLKIVKLLDTKEVAVNNKINEKFYAKIKDLESSGPSIWDRLSEDNVLFIVLFSLIAMVIGFLFRGYLIRRVEGGL